MYKLIKDTRVTELKEQLEKYKKTLEILEEFNSLLSPYTGKIIDKRFYTANNLIEKGEYRDITRYEVIKNSYSWGKPYRIYFSGSCQVELDSRDTNHVKDMVKAQLINVKKWINKVQSEIETTENIDEENIIKEVQAIYHKYQPSDYVWENILNSFEVKYPKDY